MILTSAVVMPHRNLNAIGPSVGRKRRATHASSTGDQQWQKPELKTKPNVSALPEAVRKTQDVARHRRASSQSLTLDLDGLDLGPHKLQDVAESSRRPDPSCSHPFRGKGQGEDSFAAHLRECEDAHDIASVEAVLQRPTFTPGARGMSSSLSKAVITEGNEQVLGGFASLGFVRSPRHQLAMLGSDTDVTASISSGGVSSAPVSPIPDGENNTSWTTLALRETSATATLDILSVDEMGLHSINAGSADDWRGVSLVKVADDSAVNTPKTPLTMAEWNVARSLKRQKKWIVAPSTGDAARTVVVSDHIVKGASESGSGEQQGSSASELLLFNIRFLQAGNDAPDCSIVLATPASQRSRVEEQSRLKPSTATTLSSMGLDEEQMRSLNSLPAEATEDTWPALRARTVTSAAQPTLSPRMRERRLTHSKSTSTIVASEAVQIESRRPSLGKSISHEGLAPDASPRPGSRSAMQGSSVSSGQSPQIGDDDSVRSGASSSMGRHYIPPASSYADEFAQTLPSESTSPFGEYAMDMGVEQTTPLVAQSFSPKADFRELGDLDPSPRSSVQQDSRDPALFSANRGQPVLSQIGPARLAALQGGAASPLLTGGAPPVVKAYSVAGSATHRSGPGRREKRLSEWLRRKVKPTSAHNAPTAAGATWSPPLPPAWESVTSPVSPSAPLSPPLYAASLEGNYDRATPFTAFEPLQPSERHLPARASAQPGQRQRPVASSSDEGPSLLAQRRRSNSDDIYVSTSEAERAQLRNAALSNAVKAAKQISSYSNTVGLAFPEILQSSGPTKSVSAISIPRLSEASTIVGPVSVATTAGMRRTGSGPDQDAVGEPDLLGLEDVPADAMTMLLTLPLSNNADATFASRYLRVSFVPFHDGGGGSAGSEDNFPITAYGYVGPYGDEWADAPAVTQPALHSHHNTWYKRLARPFHGGVGGASAENAEEEQSAVERGHRAQKPEEKRQSFRIIARVLANRRSSATTTTVTAIQQQRKISSALVGQDPTQYAVTAPSNSNAGLPQPFIFPVILGVYDNQGHLDLIPEGWQAIGLTMGPAPAYTNTAGGAESKPAAVPVSHPLRGVADVIIAGCAACMNL